jgi:hypothetical protein
VWEFAAGSLVAIAWRGRTSSPRNSGRSASLLAVAGSAAVLGSGLLITDDMAFPGAVAMIPVLGTVAILVAGGMASTWVSRFLATKPMTAIGDMSYSIYLWHWPIIILALAVWPGKWTATVAAVISFVPAYLAYRYVEKPLHERPLRSRARVLALSLFAIAVISLLGVTLIAVSTRVVPFASEPSEPTIGLRNGCLIMDRPFTPADIERCRFSVDGSKGWILLAGDSHAESLSTAVVSAGNALGFDVVALTGADCSFVRGNSTTARVPNCADMASDLLDIATGPDGPATVVIAHRGVPTGLRGTLEELTADGVPVVAVRDVPLWRPWGATRGPNPCQGGVLNASCEQPRTTVESHASASQAREDEVTAGLAGVGRLDLWSTFCDNVTCSAIVNGRVAYSDASHLNEWGSRAVTPAIERALREALES